MRRYAMYCKHHLPYEYPCSDCVVEALQREHARAALQAAPEPRLRSAELPRARGAKRTLGERAAGKTLSLFV